MARNLGSKGEDQGDMAPVVEDYQKPASDFSQEGFSKTLDYIPRRNAFEKKEAKELSRQSYKGRYS